MADRAGADDASTGSALRRLYDDHFAVLVRTAFLLGADDPEDIVAEAFVRFVDRREALRDPAAAGGYLRRSVVNLTRNRIAHLGVARRALPALIDPRDRPSRSEASAAGHDLLRAVEGLPARAREVVVLKYWLQLDTAEIAAARAVRPSTVRSHLFAALEAIRRTWPEVGAGEFEEGQS